MFNVKKNKKGFTLVELMVVVVIIGILTAIAIPVYNSVTTSAQEKTCKANQRTIDSAIEVALADDCTYKTSGADTSSKQFSTVDDLVTLGYLAASPKCPKETTKGYEIKANAVGTPMCVTTCTETSHRLHTEAGMY